MTAAPCQLIEWDTHFWGVPVARVQSERMTDADLAEIDAWCAEHGVACAYFLAAADDPQTTMIAERGGFFYMDVRLKLRAPLEARARPITANRIRDPEPEDLEALRDIARVSHRITRFYHDPNFPDEQCGELYAEWITASCEGASDSVLVAEVDGAAAGYLTCEVENGTIGHVGLLGVSPEHRKLGLGGELVSTALDRFALGGIGESVLYTQGHNIPALRLFARAGFMIESTHIWFHKWYDR